MRKHLLLVEDEPDTREGLTVFLEAEGYAVLQAGDGRQALELLRTRPISVVLLDVMMPIMSGWEFRQAQLADDTIADVPVVVLTADATAGERAAAAGVQAFLTKPVQLDRLLECLDRWC